MQEMYEILRKDETNEFKLQLEDWSKIYPNIYNYGSTLVIFKEAKEDIGIMIKRYKKTRFEFDFKTHSEAIKAYKDLLNNKIKPIDLINYLKDPKYAKAL